MVDVEATAGRVRMVASPVLKIQQAAQSAKKWPAFDSVDSILSERKRHSVPRRLIPFVN
jgi:hypothetical protein